MSAERRFGRRRSRAAGWDAVAGWYDGWVGERGSKYHRALAVPVALELLDLHAGEALLDIGAGQGVLAEYVSERGARYTGVDASPRLIAAARRRHSGAGRFSVGDATRLWDTSGLQAGTFDAAVFLLSIQDIDPLAPAIASAAWALHPGGRLVIVMTHPCFRQPRHSGWGYDPARKLTFRRIDAYLTPMAVPMRGLQGRVATRSYHRPLASYFDALGEAGFVVEAIRELPDLEPHERPKRHRSAAHAEAEVPLFFGMRAVFRGRDDPSPVTGRSNR